MTRTIYAALSPSGYLYALGDTEADARENALDRRDFDRDEARSVGINFPPPETDAAWSADLVFVTVTGTTRAEALNLADKFHTDRRGDWDADADRETWLDSLSVVEVRGDSDALRHLIDLAVYGVETTCTGEIAREFSPYTKREETP